jgi:hypothetical protein
MSRGRPNFHQRELQSPNKRRKKKPRKEPKAKRVEGGFHLAAVEFQLEKEREEAAKNPNAEQKSNRNLLTSLSELNLLL